MCVAAGCLMSVLDFKFACMDLHGASAPQSYLRPFTLTFQMYLNPLCGVSVTLAPIGISAITFRSANVNLPVNVTCFEY